MSDPADCKDGFALLMASWDVFPGEMLDGRFVFVGGLGVVVIPRAPLVALIVDGMLLVPLKGNS